jgi:hypothetical protein
MTARMALSLDDTLLFSSVHGWLVVLVPVGYRKDLWFGYNIFGISTLWPEGRGNQYSTVQQASRRYSYGLSHCIGMACLVASVLSC